VEETPRNDRAQERRAKAREGNSDGTKLPTPLAVAIANAACGMLLVGTRATNQLNQAVGKIVSHCAAAAAAMTPLETPH